MASSHRVRHRHDDVDRSARHRKMAASARAGLSFDVVEWDRQHHEAETQTLRYGPDMRDYLQRLGKAFQFDL